MIELHILIQLLFIQNQYKADFDVNSILDELMMNSELFEKQVKLNYLKLFKMNKF